MSVADALVAAMCSMAYQALTLDPEQYDITWPIKNGVMDASRPMTSVCTDLYDIWWTLIKQHLNICKADVHVCLASCLLRIDSTRSLQLSDTCSMAIELRCCISHTGYL
jgi:hypothetical protein